MDQLAELVESSEARPSSVTEELSALRREIRGLREIVLRLESQFDNRDEDASDDVTDKPNSLTTRVRHFVQLRHLRQETVSAVKDDNVCKLADLLAEHPTHVLELQFRETLNLLEYAVSQIAANCVQLLHQETSLTVREDSIRLILHTADHIDLGYPSAVATATRILEQLGIMLQPRCVIDICYLTLRHRTYFLADWLKQLNFFDDLAEDDLQYFRSRVRTAVHALQAEDSELPENELFCFELYTRPGTAFLSDRFPMLNDAMKTHGKTAVLHMLAQQNIKPTARWVHRTVRRVLQHLDSLYDSL